MLRDQILALKVKGLSMRAIAAQVERSPARVCQILAKCLDDMHAKNLETTQHMVQLELQRLDRLLLSHWHRRRTPDHASVILKVMERRAKLAGLDKPTKTAFTDPNGAALDPPTLIVEFTNASTAGSEVEAPDGV